MRQSSSSCVSKASRAAALVVAAAAFVLPDCAFAERFLSIAEAQKITFPQADRFDEKTLTLTRPQVAAIEKQSETKVRKMAVRLWTAIKGTNQLGVLLFDQVIGKHELIDYVVAVSAEGKVLQVEILEYRENYGGKVRDADWRAQFKGKTSRDAVKLHGDIYNISGATLSCGHVAEGIRRLLATFDLVVRPRLAAFGVPDKSTRP